MAGRGQELAFHAHEEILTPSLMPQNRKVVVYLYCGLQAYEHIKPVTKLSRISIILAIDSVFKARWSAHTNTTPSPNTHSKLQRHETL
jgi:hypothetical protein